ncbi:hypothetical protein ASD28_12655 [Massilia sp. Root133]|jgi:hypothetical protein|uniref:hypothetical protein n=1 Tax=Massilia sp. Root133 TaxID=1736455 RepID=UPI000700F956|nr:hypothetical protein [Massilia sp. Root133]KQY00175.1 hypothetical protein ASD28_12655 [Massilia sp. Root133]
MKNIAALVLALSTTFATAQEAAPTAADTFAKTSSPLAGFVEQGVEYQAVAMAGKQCGLFSDAEVSYGYKYCNVALAVMLSEREDAQASEELALKQLNQAYDKAQLDLFKYDGRK